LVLLAVSPSAAKRPTASRPFGFDLGFTLVRRDQIVCSGPDKDEIPALTNPPVVPAWRASYLKGGELVVGVVRAGRARAYPLRILVWHECVNDVLGGQPIVVTYCPLRRSAMVFDRRVGGQVREFGISGLLWNSNVLLYDRQPDSRSESLWSQVLMRAVAGPAAKRGLRLRLLPAELATWSDWKRRHPDTTVLSDRTGYAREYRVDPYRDYSQNDRLAFPVESKRTKPARFHLKERMVLVELAGRRKAYAIRDVVRAAADRGYLEDRLGPVRLRLVYDKRSDTVRVAVRDGTAEPPGVAYMYWFILSAAWPQAELYEPEPVRPATSGAVQSPAR